VALTIGAIGYATQSGLFFSALERMDASLPALAALAERAALVCAGATITFALAAVARGGPQLGFSLAGWGWIGAIALASTVFAIVTSSPGWSASARPPRRSCPCSSRS
jgi:hypothetical protein